MRILHTMLRVGLMHLDALVRKCSGQVAIQLDNVNLFES